MRVPLFEVDVGQAVYHGNYYHLFELGRESFLRDLGYPYKRFMDQELHLTIVEAHCHYRKSLHYDETIQVKTGVLWRRSRSLGLMQSILLEDGSSHSPLCTQVTLNMVCVKFSGHPTLLPADFVTILEHWMQTGSSPPVG
jgi:acyl-CoA thioester hydrolase